MVEKTEGAARGGIKNTNKKRPHSKKAGEGKKNSRGTDL